MKSLFLSLLAGFSLVATQAQACPHSQKMFICPGDKVVDSNGYVGRADGVNPFQHTVSINYGGSSDGIVGIYSTALGYGCLEGYCVGDTAVDANGYRGVIDAVNPYNGTVAINYGGSSDGIRNIESVSLGLGCVLGYCVGDKVADSNGYRGTIDAVNRFRQTAAVNYGGSSDGVSQIQTLSSAEYCSTYGDRERTLNAFPVIIISEYPSNDFRFTHSRPVRP